MIQSQSAHMRLKPGAAVGCSHLPICHALALLGMFLALTAWAAAPPPLWQALTETQNKEVAALQQQLDRHAEAGDFEAAAKVAQQIAEYRGKRQGTGHWEVIEAWFTVQYWERLSQVPAKDRAEVFRADRSNGLGFELLNRGRPQEAEKPLRQALAMRVKVLGADHPDTATSYHNLARCLQRLGKVSEALPLYQKALTINEQMLDPLHPDTAISYNSMATCLNAQGKTSEALPLYEKALAIWEKVLGPLHPNTAIGYNNLAFCHQRTGKIGEALPLFQKASATFEKVFGPLHPDTARIYNNLANCLKELGKSTEALAVFQKALAIREQVVGPLHPDTATSYNSIASCLNAQGKVSEALLLYRKALAIREQVLGPLHPDTAISYNNVAFCLQRLGMADAAYPLYQKALTIKKQVLGPLHPSTARSYNNVGMLHHNQGNWAEAAAAYESAVQGHEFGRLSASTSGFDRARFEADRISPRAGLAAMLVRLGKPVVAWEQAESDLGRGLLDDLLGPDQQTPQDRADLAELARLDTARLPLLGLQNRNATQQRRLETLSQQSQVVQKRLAERAVQRARQRMLSRDEVQRSIPEDAALVFWLDVQGDHLGCVLRPTGEPTWVRLPGSGKDGIWTADDDSLVDGIYKELSAPDLSAKERDRLLTALRKQRLDPLQPHLGGVRRLLVVPAGTMATVPVEVITDRYTISYVGSGSLHARQAAQSRLLKGESLLALGDPVFEKPADKQPKPTPLALRGGKEWKRLPGTLTEVRLLEQLVPKTTTLLGSNASQQNLNKLAASGELASYRLLHLATHGEANATHPEQTALILSRDNLPDNAARVQRGEAPIEGSLTVSAILREWKLDADLVVLSACETGLGQRAGGEGMLGFAQALLQRGARSVVLSRWKVDDGATALLMQRFYQNLLGKREGLKAPLGRADALLEAKTWLRSLTSEQALRLLATINDSVARGPGAKPLKLVKSDVAKKDDRPYEHPFYWAAFALLGDWR